MIQLPPPPKQDASKTQWEQWYEALYKYVTGSVATSGDAAGTVSSGSTYHGVTDLTAPRAVTAPATKDLADGDSVVIQDESGAAGTYAITIQRTGTDTINGGSSVTISSNYGRKTLIKRGAGRYFAG